MIPLEPMWEQYKRIIKDNGAIVLTATQPFTTALISSNMKMFKYEWIWDKGLGSNFLDAKKRPLKIHENILVFGKNIMYNPNVKYKKEYSQTQHKQKQPDGLGRIRITSEILSKTERYPTSVLKYKAERKGLHPSQKPMLLFAYLIKTYTNPGMLILDSCIGSGTTAIASMYTNRNFIGIEKEEKYYRTTLARIKSWKEHH